MDLEMGLSRLPMKSDRSTTEEAGESSESRSRLVDQLEKKRLSILKPSDEPIIDRSAHDRDRYKHMICKLDGPEDLQKVRVVAIGPYHHDLQDKNELFVTTMLKWEIVTYLQERREFDWKSYFSEIEIENKIDGLSCYELDKFKMDMDVFLEMMLLDACFLIFIFTFWIHYFEQCFSYNSGQDIFDDLAIRLEEIMLDLLMYDNQIPFSAIECVPSIELNKLTGFSIKELAFMFFDDMLPPTDPKKRELTESCGNFYHLLHLFHWSRTPFAKYELPSSSLKMFRAFPAASELQESGISFNKRGSDSPLDITFSHGLWGAFKLKGILNMPTLHITDYTKYILHILVIFEQRQSKLTGLSLWATSYLATMGQLVESEKDVKILRRSGILSNTSQTDKEVLEIIQDLDLKRLSVYTGNMKLEVHIPYDACMLCEKIKDHHGRKWNIWYGECRQNYCRNPWITLSVVAAILVFFFTGMQAVYSALSYHFPKH